MNEQYAARLTDNRWTICTSIEIICNQISEELAREVLEERTGFYAETIEESSPSTFVSTMLKALAEQKNQLSLIELDSKEARALVESLLSEVVGGELKDLRSRLSRQGKVEKLTELKQIYENEFARLTAAMEAEGLTRVEDQLYVSNHLAGFKARIKQLEGEL